jgi:predicted aspartyl protease
MVITDSNSTRKAISMSIDTMGRVQVAAKIESLEDLFGVASGKLREDQVRRVEVDDALIDTGATSLSLPTHRIAQLGLRPFRSRKARTSAGIVDVQMYDTVRLTVQGRECHLDVSEVPDDCPVLIGFIALEALDFLVDPINQRPIGNAQHGGEHMIDLF